MAGGVENKLVDEARFVQGSCRCERAHRSRRCVISGSGPVGGLLSGRANRPCGAEMGGRREAVKRAMDASEAIVNSPVFP
jgi:hypothetical protein